MSKLDFLCFSINNWEKRKARKQQFMIHLARRSDVSSVFYIEPPINIGRLLIFVLRELRDVENRRRWARALTLTSDPVDDKIRVFTPLFLVPFAYRFQWVYNVNWLLASLALQWLLRKNTNPRVLWLYHPFDHCLLGIFRDRALAVFDWAEEWSKFFSEFGERRKEMIVRQEKRIMASVDIVFVCSQHMLAMARQLNPRSHHILDGTVYDIFQAPSPAVPDDLRTVHRPIVGYIGTVNRRVDLDLIGRLGDSMPDVSFVFIGDVHHQHIDLSPLRELSNVFFLGGKEYRELGVYAANFDAFMLPYRPELTLQSPTKIFDYFAAGKPVVSTDLVELKRFADHVFIARSADEFASLLRTALADTSGECRQQRMAIAKDNSWAVRADEIMCRIREIVPL